jgi:hypothetical protein
MPNNKVSSPCKNRNLRRANSALAALKKVTDANPQLLDPGLQEVKDNLDLIAMDNHTK